LPLELLHLLLEPFEPLVGRRGLALGAGRGWNQRDHGHTGRQCGNHSLGNHEITPLGVDRLCLAAAFPQMNRR
jgi:hypothetical protein